MNNQTLTNEQKKQADVLIAQWDDETELTGLGLVLEIANVLNFDVDMPTLTKYVDLKLAESRPNFISQDEIQLQLKKLTKIKDKQNEEK